MKYTVTIEFEVTPKFLETPVVLDGTPGKLKTPNEIATETYSMMRETFCNNPEIKETFATMKVRIGQ